MSDVGPEFLALQRALIGRYSLEREVGRGGMGIVFLARDVALDRPIAIKLLPPAMAAKPDLRGRFLSEARTAAKLSQPNIVPIHDVEELGDLVFFVMAYVDGETLGDRLRRHGPLTPHDAARMLQEVAWALAYAHGRGVVHRDVKPDNIMLERGTGRAVVMDFGIARPVDTAASGEIIGTAQYMSPEQARGDPVDGRSDLYGLGVVGFLALTGRLPFEAEDTTGLLAMHLTRDPPPVAAVAPGLPSKLARAIDRCLVKEAAGRFPTGEALAEAVAASIEPKRELPVPVRLWLTKGEELKMAYVLWYMPAGGFVGGLVGSAFSQLYGATAGVVLGIATYVLGPAVIHGVYRLWRLQKLLARGYGLQDIRLAVRQAAEKKREELSYAFGHEPPLWAKVVRGVTLASFGAFLAILAGAAAGIDVLQQDSAVLAALWAGGAALLGAIVGKVKPGKRIDRDVAAEHRLKFWNSRIGAWLARAARTGIKPATTPLELTYRPTELAIGLAADALFEALPKDQKRELKDLPMLLERLQHDAQLMRKTVDDLNGAIAGLGEQAAASRSAALAGEAGATLVEARDRLRADLVAKRDEAATRLSAAVAALESLRLNLLRLKAGTGTVNELTADLGAAREVQEQMNATVEARHEVETLLKGARTSISGQHRVSGPHGG